VAIDENSGNDGDGRYCARQRTYCLDRGVSQKGLVLLPDATESIVPQHVASVDEGRSLLPTCVEAAGVIALVVGMLDHIGVEDAIVTATHLLDN
jgi:hypothetical protein